MRIIKSLHLWSKKWQNFTCSMTRSLFRIHEFKNGRFNAMRIASSVTPPSPGLFSLPHPCDRALPRSATRPCTKDSKCVFSPPPSSPKLQPPPPGDRTPDTQNREWAVEGVHRLLDGVFVRIWNRGRTNLLRFYERKMAHSIVISIVKYPGATTN